MKQIPIANLYYMLCYAWGILPPQGAHRTAFDDFSTPIEIIGSEICRVSTTIIKRQLALSFVNHLEQTRRPHGRINFTRSLRGRGFKRNVLTCLSPTISIDTLPNQILKASLRTLSKQENLKTDIRKDAFSLEQRLSGVANIVPTRDVFRRLGNMILPRAYRYPLALSELLFLQFSPTDTDGRSWFDELVRDETRMRRVFEAFVRGFLREHMPNARVGARRIPMSTLKVMLDDQSLIPFLNMDVVVEFFTNKALVIDTKYTANQLTFNHETKKIRSDHFYQIFTYVSNVRIKYPSFPVSGLVLYPLFGKPMNVEFSTCGFNFFFKTIDLSLDWKAIHTEILNIIYQIEAMPSPTANASIGGTAFPISLA